MFIKIIDKNKLVLCDKEGNILGNQVETRLIVQYGHLNRFNVTFIDIGYYEQ